MYKKWNKSVINEQINKLAVLAAEKPDTLRYQRDLVSLCELANNKTRMFEPDVNFQEQIKHDKKLIERNKPFINDITTLTENIDDSIFKNMEGRIERSIPQKYLLSFVHDFYNSIDKDFAHIFNKMYKDRKDNLRLTRKESDGYRRNYITYIKTLNYPYINIHLYDTIDDFLSIVHEYAHAISDYMCFRPQYGGYPFIELLPMFMEKLASEILLEDFDGMEEDMAICDALTTKTILRYANEISLENNFLSNNDINCNRRAFITNMANFTGDTKSKIERMMDVPLEEKLTYTIPYLTMIEFYTLYNKDPKEAMFILKELIRARDIKDYYEFLQHNNIILNEHSKEFIEEQQQKVRLTHHV